MLLAQWETVKEIPVKTVSGLEQQETVNEILVETVSGLGTIGNS